jgi:pilus assembly protein FimV
MPKTDTSTQYFETRLNQAPQSLVFSRLADCYRKNGEFQQAISVCMEGLRNHPDCVTGRLILGRCYLEQEKLQEAVAELVKAVELDSRNQASLKMIADIYSGQGLKEKAGDLYSFLLRMDPDNKPLVKLAGAFPGQGETSVLKILGTAGGATGLGAEQDYAGQMPSDMIEDADRTIQMDFSSRRPEKGMQDNVDFGETLVQTQQFDRSELSAAKERTEEFSGEASDKQDGVVTGDDISSRMDNLFGEDETPAAVVESAEEPPADTSVKHEGNVTGEDISSRMDTLFGEEKAPAAAAEDAEELSADTSVKHGGSVTGDDISSRMDTLFGEEIAPAAVEPEAHEHIDIGTEQTLDHAETSAQTRADAKDDWVVSGSDISSRLEQLFGEEQKAEEAEKTGPEADFTQIIDTQEMTAEMHPSDSKTSLFTAPTKELQRDELRLVESSDISREDITSHLNDMFDAAPAAEPLGKDTDAGGKPSVEIEEAPVFDVATDISASGVTDATEQIAVPGPGKAPAAEAPGQDTDAGGKPAVEIEEPPVFDVVTDSSAKSMTGATEEIALPGAGRTHAGPVEGTGISGDDVTLRLETIFDEGEAEAAEPDVAGTDVIPAEEIGNLPPEEEVKKQVDKGESAIVIGDEDEGIEETIVAPAAKLRLGKNVSNDNAPAAAPAIDDMEEDDASPGMSGDDVAGRLEEYFGDSGEGADLKPAVAAAGSDKEEDAAAEEILSVSGEKARIVESDETMVSDLDESEETMISDFGQSEDTMLSTHGPVDTAVHEAETLNMAREPEEKTVLMDEDGGEDTMPAKEEAVISGVSDPFLPKPSRARAKIDDSEKDETVRAAAPPSRRGDIFSAKSPEKPRDEEPDTEQTQAYSIPDHVLTPTLADIYFQQGQPQLALQIYRRLLAADPDNERMAQRIAEIERSIATQEVEETVAMEHARKKTVAPAEPAAPQPEKKPKKSVKSRPLAGVRIKRKFKAKRKKSK